MSLEFFERNRKAFHEEYDTLFPDDRAWTHEAFALIESYNQQSQPILDGRHVSPAAFLKDALKSAQERSARSFDAFVHYQWPWREQTAGVYAEDALLHMCDMHLIGEPEDIRRCLTHWRSDYKAAITNIMRTAADPLFIEYEGSQKDMPEPIPCASRSLLSQSGLKGVTGFLPFSEMTRMVHATQGLHPGDSLRIHGASYRQCPPAFGVQWFAMHTLGWHLPAPWSVEADLSYAVNHVHAMIDESSLARDARIQMGTQFDLGFRYGNPPSKKGFQKHALFENEHPQVYPCAMVDDILQQIRLRLLRTREST